jgi:predicted dehydrogenase
MINVTPGWLPSRSFEDLVKAKLEDFVAHVLDDTPTVAPGEHGIMIQQMLDAIYASAEQGGKEIAIQ